jgi:hypothetical protein
LENISVVRIEHVSFLLPDFIRGSLGRDETARVETHLRLCTVCRSELEELTNAFASIADHPRGDVPKSYFPSILPRIRERLDQRRSTPWIQHPLVSRIVLPLGAVIIVAALVWQIPAYRLSAGNQNQLSAVVDSATAEEMAEMVQANIPNHDLSSFNNEIMSGVMADERFVNRELVREALAGEPTSPFNVYADVSSQQFLDDLHESEVDDVLRKLGTMGAL